MQNDSLRRIDRQYTIATTGLCGPVQFNGRLGIAGIIAIYIYTYIPIERNVSFRTLSPSLRNNNIRTRM